MLSLLLASLCLPTQSGGVESVLQDLQERAAADRELAAKAWDGYGERWLKDPSDSHFSKLAAHAPAIQESLLGELQKRLGPDDSNIRRTLLTGLQEVLSPGGAERLVHLVAKMPPSIRIEAYRAALSRGSRSALPQTEALLAQPEVAAMAFLILAEFGPLKNAESWFSFLATAISPDAKLQAGLEALALREGIPEKLSLPPSWMDSRDPDLVLGMLRFLLASPSRLGEAIVLESFQTMHFPAVTRLLALDLAKAQTKTFRWPRVKRTLARHLKDNPNDPLASNLAWTLHSLGDRSGRKFLVGDLDARVRRNPSDWRLKVQLGTRLVDLSEFSSAYKEFRSAIGGIKGTPTYGRVKREEWLAAARAACGSRHLEDGEIWLRNARMSPGELQPYRNLPEFEDALKHSAFRRLFGVR